MQSPELAPTILWRALRLRCPHCGRGRFLAHGFSAHNECQVCGLRFVREDGYWTGAIYVNLIVTQFLIVGAVFVLMFGSGLPITSQILILAAVAILFPTLFYPLSKSLWLAMDYFFTGATWGESPPERDIPQHLDSQS